MTKILCFTQTDITTFSNEEISLTSYQPDNTTTKYYDAIICDQSQTGVFDSNRPNLPSYILKIAMIKTKEEARELDSSLFDTWILENRLELLPKLILSQKQRIELARKVFEDVGVFAKTYASNDINKKSVDLIGLNMKRSTSQVRDIFEAQVDEMKKIHTEIKDVRGIIIHDNKHPSEHDLEDATHKTDELLARTDEVVKSMFGFVRVLQCEDRITQMLEGVKNVINFSDSNVVSASPAITQEQIKAIQNDLVGCFTIDEQRELAHGETDLEKLVECREHMADDGDNMELF